MKKTDEQSISKEGLSFWFCAGLLGVLLVSIMGRDITRPFYGLHSWAEAHGPWLARVHLTYGFGYTKGFMTHAVGNPPSKNPSRYLDHPHLGCLLDTAAMAILGIHNWSLRVVNTTATVVALLLFLKILKGLLDEKTALLAGLFLCLFPLIGYFGIGFWLYPSCLWAIWNYLVIIYGLKNGPEPAKRHKIALAFCLFMMLQLSWEGFFFALGIGVHYVCRCIYRRTLPDKSLLAILVIAPLSSLALDFLIMAAGYGWNWQKIIDLYKWRAGSGEMEKHIWSAWFGQFWEHANTNFTLPLMITAIVYLTFGQLVVFTSKTSEKAPSNLSRRFPHFWLFIMPPVFQLFLLKGCLWRHQTWERPFCFFIAIATAQAVMLLGDILKNKSKRLANAVMASLVGLFLVFGVIGTNYYYGIRWQSPAKIELLETLKRNIPPDKALLSFEDFVVNQHPAKGAFYRPEVAWHLDRDVVRATTLAEVLEYAKSRKYPYYLVPLMEETRALINELSKQFKYQYISGDQGEMKDGKFYKAGMMPYMIFDLTGKVAGSD
ncbi:MAG: hypothetical protein WAK60_06890 [Sedimentisphaerales bacterium]